MKSKKSNDADSGPMVTGVLRVPKRIVVASGKGGSGKTTTTRNLAVAAVHADLLVTTVDLDESPTLTTWWKRRPELLPAIEHMAAPIDQIDGDLRGEVEAIGDCDLLIVDTPPSLTAYPQHARGLIRSADLVLVPCQQYDEDLDAVAAWITLANDLGARSLILLNRTQRRESSFEAAKRRLVKLGRLCPIDIPHFADVPKTFTRGLGVAEVRGAKGGADYEAVLDHLRSEVGF
ncbi:MAG: ParA family protein [Roseomonas mucosa]|nr:ParA family protein [Roseomonas mucosa]